MSSAEELRIYCWDGYAPEHFVNRFEKFIRNKYNIDLKVTVNSVSSAEDLFGVIRAQTGDIVSPAHNIPKSPRWKFIREKMILPIDINNIPNYQYIIPDLKYADYITEDGKLYGVPIVYGYYGLAYNTKLLKEEPTSWNVFWEKQYLGKYTVSADYYEANIYITALSLGFDRKQIFNYEILSKSKRMKQRLSQLAQGAHSFWVGVDTAEKLSGLSVATAWGFAFPKLRQSGEVWKFSAPKEGTTGWVDNWVIGFSLEKKPMLKRIAEEWINYSIGEDMQLDYVNNIAQFPVNTNLKGLLSPEKVKAFHLDDPAFIKKNIILWEVLSQREQNGFKYMWEDAKKVSRRLKK